LKFLEEEATTSEIAEQARRKYPHRMLHSYVGQLLNQLQEKRFVKKSDELWELTPQGAERSIKRVPIDEIDSVVSDTD
jgi:hypothetical protein